MHFFRAVKTYLGHVDDYSLSNLQTYFYKVAYESSYEKSLSYLNRNLSRLKYIGMFLTVCYTF